MAMNMEPDTIYFMTDGSGGDDKLVDELLAYNKEHGNTEINTICMMILKTRQLLEKLSESTGGEFTLIQNDGKAVRGRALDRL